MYIYGIQSDRMHSFHPKHSNLESRCFRCIRPHKSPKIAQKTDHSIAIFSIFLNRYGIFWMVPGESPFLEGSEYVWQREVGGL